MLDLFMSVIVLVLFCVMLYVADTDIPWVCVDNKGYFFKWPIIHRRSFDIHLLKMTEGCVIEPHYDDAIGYNHHRLNIILKKPKSGGIFSYDGYETRSRVVLFRPDVEKHQVSKVTQGTRYVLSFGLRVKQ